MVNKTRDFQRRQFKKSLNRKGRENRKKPLRLFSKDSAKIRKLKHKTRRLNIKEGIFASIKNSIGNYYVSPFAIAINSSNSLVAMLSSVSGLLGPLSQLFSSKLIEKNSRKKIVRKSVLFESIMWLPFVIIAFLFYKGILINFLPLFLLLSFALMTIFSNIAVPAWFSWTGDIVDEKFRGRWFSKRNLIIGFVAVISGISASFFLEFLKKNNLDILGFGVLFLLAFIFRMFSWKIFKKQYEPKIKLKKTDYFSFFQFLKKAPKNNFGKFAIFRALLGFAASISSPLLSVYLLRYLKFNYPTYIAIIFAGTIFSLFVMEIWGKFADKYGNYKTLFLTSILIPIIPIVWILSPSPVYLFFIPSIISGVSWAGFNIASGNFIYDNVRPEKRGLAVSYYNMLIGIGIFFGAALGAILIKVLKTKFIEPIFLIFIFGALMRMIVVFWWLPKFKEIRKTKKLHSSKFIKNLFLKDAKPALIEEAHQIMSIKKYISIK